MILIALALGASAVGGETSPAVTVGKETTILSAGGGGLRDWQIGPNRGIVYVRDRINQWYQVKLSGPCVSDPVDNLTYTTDSNGTFDKFSTIRFGRYPQTTCGVTSIRTSTPPPGRPSAKKK